MKRFVCLALLLAMLAASVCAMAAGSTVTSEGVGYTNIPYSGGYRGFCIDRQLTGAYEGDVFTVAQNTSIADNNVTHEDISQKLKVLFAHCFEDIFVSDGNGSYEIPSSMADAGLGLAVYHFAGEQSYVWGESKALVEKVNAYTGPIIPDHGYQKTLEMGILSNSTLLCLCLRSKDSRISLHTKLRLCRKTYLKPTPCSSTRTAAAARWTIRNSHRTKRRS